MDRLNPKALASQAASDERRLARERALLSLAKARSLHLLSQLSPLFPAVAAATRDPSGMEAWTDSWARQILHHRLSENELSAGLQKIAEVMRAAGNPPFSFPLLLEACRPTHLTAQDQLARTQTLPALPQNLLQNQSWCASRDASLARCYALLGKPRPKLKE